VIQTTTASQLLTAIAGFVNTETSADVDYVHTDYPDAYVRVEIEGRSYLLSLEDAGEEE